MKSVILVGAVLLLCGGALSNLQWSMNEYGLLNKKQVLALDASETTGTKKGKMWVKEFSGETKEVQETVEQTTTVKVGPVTRVDKTTYTRPKTLYKHICKAGDKLKTCATSWDSSSM